MTSDNPGLAWTNLFNPEQVADAGEDMVEQQRELFRQMLSMSNAGMNGSGNGLGLGALCTNTGTFKTRVQSGGRISIPDAEREALDIEEGDIVQTIVVPVSRDRADD
ncbi:AbrB/MazE/SpoVT family DNA-binding domain-containing protein [Halosegnis sp.]|uniref:AbrB/MazE/SpoVT family DNA-binding domain-containing protein n=1 Tax=Halosegnis sp. TaxID=2864959 RepID=UPI0035D4F67A